MIMKSLFINDNFTNLLFARIISYAGTSLQGTAIALYIIDKEPSVSSLAIALSLVIIPQILFGPVGGLAADRFNKRTIMMVSDIFGLCVALFLCFSVNAGRVNISYIYLASILFSLSIVFFAPAMDSIFPQLMTKEELTKGNSVYNGSLDVVQIVAPMLGAAIYSVLGIKWVFLINAFSFFLSCYFLFKVNVTVVNRIPLTELVNENKLFKTFKELFKPAEIFLKDRTLRDMMLFNYVIGVFVLPLVSIGFISLLKNTLKLNNYFFGYLQSTLVIGAFIGAILVNKMSKNKTSLQCVSLSLFMLAVVLILQSLCVYALNVFALNRFLMYALILILGFFLSFILRLFYIPMHVIVQSNTELGQLGRVSSFYWMLTLIAQPMGQLSISYFIDRNALVSWLVLSSSIVLVTFLYSSRKEALICVPNSGL